MRTSSNWKEKYHIFWHDTDKTGKMSLAAISRYLQETAWKNAEALGFGYNRAKELNQFWVLVRQLINMDRLPLWGETIEIETWPRDVDGIWAFRDYLINDEKGNRLGGVASSWMVVDGETHRPQKPEIVRHALPILNEKMALGEAASKIVIPENCESIDSRLVRFTDMDYNGHVNNAKYIEWAMDALSLNNLLRPFQNLLINFISEAVEGESVKICCSPPDQRISLKGSRKKDDRDIFTLELW
ncbi:MAG: hypothetical protein KDC05_07895 [Bacteroidales bacterium]|nr:hypothetical protein [Bacteroidales bacterium]